MSIASLVTRGFSNGSFIGSIGELVTMGYDISTIIPPTIPVAGGIISGGSLGNGLLSDGSTGNGLTQTASTGNGKTSRGRL
jgi:hypothetical protein